MNLAGEHRVDGATGVAIVYVQDDGENSILLSSGANLSVTAERVEECADLIEAAAVLVLQGEIPRPAVEAAARHCRGRLVFNLAPVMAVDADVLRRADPLVVNEYEGRIALEMLGMAVPGDDEGVVAPLLAVGVPAVVLTREAKGALAFEASGLVEVPSPRVKVVDTTGAGDAFVGALEVCRRGSSLRA